MILKIQKVLLFKRSSVDLKDPEWLENKEKLSKKQVADHKQRSNIQNLIHAIKNLDLIIKYNFFIN